MLKKYMTEKIFIEKKILVFLIHVNIPSVYKSSSSSGRGIVGALASSSSYSLIISGSRITSGG